MVALADITPLPALSLPPQENALSRRYLRLLEAWVPFGLRHFAPWPERPDCGHFFGGCHWYGAETSGPALALALAAASPEYDAAATGAPPEVLQRTALRAVRYLCFTHDTGPADCVRPATGLGRPENCATKWGERGKGFFRESQCGPTVVQLGLICLLLRAAAPGLVDDETWAMVARMHEDYGERFGELPPRSGVYLDTQMEENYWTAHGLNGVSLFLARHERAAAWQEMARRWLFAACAAPQDAKDHGAMGAATVRAATGKTVTALPDYWAENHGMVHPSYTAAGVRSLLTDGVLYQLYGTPRAALPPELFWNRRRIYENLKALTDGSGYVMPAQGMDWHYLAATGDEAPHAVAAVFFDDADAAALQRRGLRLAELRQQGNGGRLYDADLAARAHDVQDPMLMREAFILRAAELYLLHRVMGPGPRPAPEAALEGRLAGVRHFPHAGFVHHRHPRGQTAVSWRNSVMALPLPREGLLTVAPASDSFLGQPVVAGAPDSHHLVSVRVREHDRGFAVAFVLGRCQESLRQEVLVASLPDGRALTFERFVALADVRLEALDQGFLRIVNERFPRLGPNSRGARTLFTPAAPGGAVEYRGWIAASGSPGEDVVDVYDAPAWLNVDGRLGVRFAGSGRTVYHNRHTFTPYRAVADDLTLSRLPGPLAVARGAEAASLATLLLPEATAPETAGAAFGVYRAAGGAAVCLVTDGGVAAAAFAPLAGRYTFALPRPAALPLLPGATLEARGDRLLLSAVLEARGAALFPALGHHPVDPGADVRLDVMPDGTPFVTPGPPGPLTQ